MDDDERGLQAASELFKALSSVSRLSILRTLSSAPATVSELVVATGLSQPLVSQHLRTLRSAGLAVVTRTGREATYAIADQHIIHVVEDAISHVREGSPSSNSQGTR